MHAEQKKIVDRFVKCLGDRITESYPLVEGETIEKEFATYLAEPLLNFSAGTAVIKRTTNMAEINYIISNVMVDERGDLLGAEVRMRVPRALKAEGSESFAAKMGTAVLTGMASAIGGAIANYIIGQIFPPDVPSYFDKVYERMTSIVGQALERDKIDSINGALNTITNRLRDEYAKAKEESNLELELDRKNLFDLLQKYDATFISGPGGMLGTLQLERYSLAGFAAFLLGASLQLALFQEMANVVLQKKDGKWLKPDVTSYGKPKTGTLAVTAKQFAEFVDKTWPKVIEARLKVINIETYEANKRVVPGDVYWELWGRINDNGTLIWPRRLAKSAEKDGSYPTMNDLKNDLERYKNQIRTEITLTYSDPAAFSGKLRQSIDRPILLA